MHKFVYFLIILSLFAQKSFGSVESIEDLQSCLNEAMVNHDPIEGPKIINQCYDKALPWAHSPSIKGRALYAQALSFYVTPMDGRSSYESSAKKLANYYFAYLDKELTSQLIHSLSNNDLSILIESLFSIEFYTGITFNKSVALNKFLNVFKEMEIRKIATIEQAQNIYTALLRYGNWADSREVLKSWPTISPSIMPIIEDIEKISDDELGYYVLSADLKTLDLKKLNNDKGPKIIMFADCHFAFDVFKYLGQEKDLTEIMSQWGLVVGGYDFDKIDLLRKQFPSFEIHPMHVQGSWFQKGFDIFSSPSTVFLKDGIIKYRTTGSTGRYIVSDFCRGLDSIGLALPLSCTK